MDQLSKFNEARKIVLISGCLAWITGIFGIFFENNENNHSYSGKWGWLSKYLDELLGSNGSDYFLLLIGSWLIYSAKCLSASKPSA